MTCLSGCAGTVYKTQLEIYCPPIITYSAEDNIALADEIDALPEGDTAIVGVIADYAALRDKIRACEKKRDDLASKRN